MCKQFKKGKRIDVIPILNAWAEEETEEENVPDVIMDFSEDEKQESIFASWNLVVQNVGGHADEKLDCVMPDML